MLKVPAKAEEVGEFLKKLGNEYLNKIWSQYTTPEEVEYYSKLLNKASGNIFRKQLNNTIEIIRDTIITVPDNFIIDSLRKMMYLDFDL